MNESSHTNEGGLRGRIEPLSEPTHVRMRRRWLRRRAALLVAVLIAVTLIFIQQRGHAHRGHCRDSLEHYARLLVDAPPDASVPELLEAQWNGLEQGGVVVAPSHYRVLPRNWLRAAAEQDRPLVVCRHPHSTLLSSGRHVLVRTGSGYAVQWRMEDTLSEDIKLE